MFQTMFCFSPETESVRKLSKKRLTKRHGMLYSYIVYLRKRQKAVLRNKTAFFGV